MAKKTDDNQAVTTNRQKITERLRSRNPELNTEDDELLFGQISSDYDTFDQRDQERERFNEAIAKNPESAGILTGLYTGKNEDGSDFDLGMYLIDEYPEMVEDLIEGNPKVKERYIASRDNRKAAAEEEKTFAAQVAEKTASLARHRYDVARRLYILGKSTILDFNAATSEKDSALRSHISALQTYWSLYYGLRSMMGK